MTEYAFALAPIVGLLLLVATALAPAAEVAAPEVIRLDPQARQQVLDGWGTSICWWGNAIGSWPAESPREDLLDLLFDRTKGLGLNIVRYNIGGGENPNHHHMTRWRDMPGFRPDPTGPYRWEADAGQRWALQGAIARGVTITEAFSNSPPWWMTISGCASGNGGRPATNNLREDSYDAFADYLVAVVAQYRDRWGITFDTLSPLNEPDADWWTYGGSQEGCRFTPDKQQLLLDKVAKRLSLQRLPTRLCAPEESLIDWTTASWKSYTLASQALISRINTHSYGGDGRAALREAAQAAGKRLWMSEYGNGTGGELGSALELARVITLDLNDLGAQGWVYWQAIEDDDLKTGWGAISASYSGTPSYAIRKQYWVLLQFTRHLPAGSVILHSAAPDVAAGLDPAGRLVMVIGNRADSPRSVGLDLSAFSQMARKVECYRTSEEESHVRAAPLSLMDHHLAYRAPAESVTTLVAGTR